MNIEEKFEQLKKEKRAGLIVYITAGCPSIELTLFFETAGSRC